MFYGTESVSAARLCAISGVLMFCLVVGSQMIEAYNYSSVSLTKV